MRAFAFWLLLVHPLDDYNAACAEAKAGHNDAAFKLLDGAIRSGLANMQLWRTDPDLPRLHSDARWPGLLARADEVGHPCRKGPHAREFDFWLGEWEVRNPKGRVVGHSRIEAILGGCVILEDWSGVM